MAGKADTAGHAWPVLAIRKYEPLQRIRARYRDRLTEISINGPQNLQVRIAGEGYVRLPPADSAFVTRAWFSDLCSYFAAAHGVNWSADLPLIACRTPDADRFMGIEGPNVESGFAASIRIKRVKKLEYADFGLDAARADILSGSMADGKTICLSGGTGSGKTALFNLMCRAIPPHHRVITAEDTRELEINVPNKIHFIVSRTEAHTRIRYNEITDTTLRLNPDRYIFGELSIQNAFALTQALDTGHEGAGTTGHANSCFDFMRGMRRRVALGGGLGGSEIGDMLDFIADNVHLIVQVKHMPVAGNTERRLVTEMAVPKELLARRKRGDLMDAMRHDDKVVDLQRARDVLLQVNAGEDLSPIQKELLRTLALLGMLRSSPSSPANSTAAADPVLSPEEQFFLEARARGRLQGGDDNSGLQIEAHGSMANAAAE